MTLGMTLHYIATLTKLDWRVVDNIKVVLLTADDFDVSARGYPNAEKVAKCLVEQGATSTAKLLTLNEIARRTGLDPGQVSRTTTLMPGFVRVYTKEGTAKARPVGVFYLERFDKAAPDGKFYPRDFSRLPIADTELSNAKRVTFLMPPREAHGSLNNVIEKEVRVEVMPDPHPVFKGIRGEPVVVPWVTVEPDAREKAKEITVEELNGWINDSNNAKRAARLAHIFTSLALTLAQTPVAPTDEIEDELK